MDASISEIQRRARREGFQAGILFVLGEMAHGVGPKGSPEIERALQRIDWVLNRLSAADAPFSLEDLDDHLPRTDGTRIRELDAPDIELAMVQD